MRLRLVLFRHARAAPPSFGDDHERPLEPVGWREAAATARRLQALGWAPERILCSDARRTRETAEACAGAWPDLPPAEPTARLYEANRDVVAGVVASAAGSAATVWVIGHNPTMEELSERLSHRRVGLGTANAVLLELDADAWPEALARRWQFVDLVAPAAP